MSKLIPNQPQESPPEEVYDQLELFDVAPYDQYDLIESTDEEFLSWLLFFED